MEIELGQLIRAFRRWWWTPVVVALVLGLLGFGVVRVTETSSYTATTQMLVTEQISGDAVLSSDARTETYLALVTSGPVLDRVILELGLDHNREDLAQDVIDVRVINGTQIIEISVTTDDSELSANIANSLARNFVVTATDLSVGELERNLADLRAQTSSNQDRITVIDTRLAEIDVEENADNSEVQAEIRQLEREKLQLSQTVADLESTTRELNTSLNTMSIPVLVTDFATPPEEPSDAVSPVLIALLGAFLGALIGIAWITWSAFTDRTLRGPDQIVSHPLLARISRKDITSEDSESIALVAAKLAGVRKASGNGFVLTSARNSARAAELRALMAQVDAERLGDMESADSVLTTAAAMQTAANADHVVVIAESGATNLEDLEELVQVLAAMNTSVIGTILVE